MRNLLFQHCWRFSGCPDTTYFTQGLGNGGYGGPAYYLPGPVETLEIVGGFAWAMNPGIANPGSSGGPNDAASAGKVIYVPTVYGKKVAPLTDIVLIHPREDPSTQGPSS